MRWALLILLLLHGAIHFMGVAKAFAWADLEQLTQPISRGMGVVWLAAGLTSLGAALHLAVAPRSWWITGLVAVGLSQAVIVSSWSDARFGTVANLLILLAVTYTLLSQGPWSFRAQYERGVSEASAVAATTHGEGPGAEGAVLDAADLTGLPDPVRRYIEASGFVGQPRIAGFRASSHGRIRGRPDDAWMPFEAVQQNTVHPPSRLFHMKARRAGLPVDVLHVFRDGRATMTAKVLSLVPVAEGRGAEMDQAETVTLFNDLALMAPGALADPGIRWESVDARSARGIFTYGDHTISAVLHFDGDELVDFVSDDRFAAVGGDFAPWRWSTPVVSHQWVGPEGHRVRVVREGKGVWHPDDAESYSYLELELRDIELLTPGPQGLEPFQKALRRRETAAALPDSVRPSGL